MRTCMFAFAAALAASSAFAHGPQIQITRDNDQITTRRLFPNERYDTHLSSPTSAYVMRMGETNGVWYSRPNEEINPVTMLPAYVSGPGIAYGYDQVDGGARVFAAGEHFELNLIDGLKWWNGAAFVDPGLEEIEAHRISSNVIVASAITADSLTPATPATMAYGNLSASYNSNSHSGALFRLLGDGADPTSASDDGVYLLKMTYSSTEPGLAASDPFYFVLSKNASPTEVNDAVATLPVASHLVQYVPEPATGLLCGIALAGFVVVTRHRVRDRR